MWKPVCCCYFPFVVVAAVAAGIMGHSILINPTPRNAVDRDLPQWANGALPTHCEHPSYENSTTQKPGRCWGCRCTNGTETCNAAQTCVWFSQGCSIGCSTCDGKESNPNTRDRCGSGMKPTNNDPKFRTYNRDVPAMSKGDWTQHNPWRAPGNAPVYDSCGMAGGSPTWVRTQLSYVDTVHAKQGDLGSKVLPPLPTGIEWAMGSEVETKIGFRAAHGGGYQYRLCPLNSTLDEECFRKTTVPFANKTFLEWGNGTRMSIQGLYLSEGTTPANSTWKMNPLPYSDAHSPPQFVPPCHETVDRRFNDTGLCSGRFPWDVSVIDTLMVPRGLQPGPYVLGFRWDCEATAQVWTSCADITITA